MWRVLDEAAAAALKRVEKARARTRRHVWKLLPSVPASKVAGTDGGDGRARRGRHVGVRRIRRRNRRRQRSSVASGSIPLGVWCDNTTGLLAVTLRPGNAGSNHAGDHINVLRRAIDQVPAARRRGLLIRADRAGATHELLDWLTEQGQVRGRRLEYSIGFPTKNTALTSAITKIPEQAWAPAVTADGEIREGADVAEATGLLDLRRWPTGMRVIVRRERPHPAPSCRCWKRPTAGATNPSPPTPGVGSSFLQARHRAHARVKDRIKAVKDSGLGRGPSREHAIKQACPRPD